MPTVVDKVIEVFMGSKHERENKRLAPVVAQINAIEPALTPLSDAGLRERLAAIRQEILTATAELPEEYVERRKLVQATLDAHLPEVFALVREASRRVLGMRHFDVQLIGGIVLHEGKIAEMRTGEGKTLVATLPVVLNALTGRGVHVVTVNDYLAKRDAEWMGRLYTFLGLTVGCIQNQMGDAERKQAYGSDITYGTNNEFGFDYLRDNMKFEVENMVQKKHVYAIVDEVDSILVDEARTPLIISGPSELSVGLYYQVDHIIPKLVRGEETKDKYGNKSTTGDYLLDEKAHTASLTEDGVAKAEKLLGVPNLYDPTNIETLHAVQQALRAHALYQVDRDYIVKDGQVIIVDEFTGRLMPGRRWSDGLHQAVEAKQGVKIEAENQTLATITLQNYFRMYEKLAGMTGTAETEADEFAHIYGLDVVVIPTNREMIRIDNQDLIFRTEKEKWKAVVEEIIELHEAGQPVLVGTVSIEKSERLSELLKRRNVPHVVLNAKYHEREAGIVAQAGRYGAVTIATNMAGRGTDIILGGNPEGLARAEADPAKEPEAYPAALEKYQAKCVEEREKVLAAGGLHILGTERHEARRIDNQLRGRSGRQGDPGSSRFILSLEDDLMRIFASDRLREWMKHLGMEEDVPIESKMVTRSIERAQKQVEARNFEVRKHLLEYDDVMNKQREAVYRLRRDVLEGKQGREWVQRAAREIADSLVDSYCPEDKHPDEWQHEPFERELKDLFGMTLAQADLSWENVTRPKLAESLVAAVEQRFAEREATIGADQFRQLERYLILSVLDAQWKDHLLALDHLKEGIGMRAYGQRDPLVEYKRESFDLFQEMMERVEDQVVQYLYRVELVQAPPQQPQHRQPVAHRESKAEASGLQGERREAQHSPTAGPPTTVRRSTPKVGRNDPCPCGSGKKYKKCHGATESAAAG
ncbi:MAG TPA: preprotein translocase subunit SecA [Thermoanaerobaculaceae bacterium]|nr:preprotein translocase subunit SecA [Thermoanaerobaculaceae bacterium]